MFFGCLAFQQYFSGTGHLFGNVDHSYVMQTSQSYNKKDPANRTDTQEYVIEIF